MIDQLHRLTEEHGVKCLSDVCKNPHAILWWECGQGHRWQAPRVRVEESGTWCPACSRVTRTITIIDMKSLAAGRGGECLSDAYRGANARHLWECSKGHQWEATPAAIKRGSWCPNCAGNAKPTIGDMQEVAESRSGRCLSDTYINSQTKMLWECIEGHQWEATPNKIKSGRWCPKCANKHRGDFRKLSIGEMIQIAKDRGGKCLSKTYTNNRTKLLWECGGGHQWGAVPSDVKKGSWCPECYHLKNSTRPKSE